MRGDRFGPVRRLRSEQVRDFAKVAPEPGPRRRRASPGRGLRTGEPPTADHIAGAYGGKRIRREYSFLPALRSRHPPPSLSIVAWGLVAGGALGEELSGSVRHQLKEHLTMASMHDRFGSAFWCALLVAGAAVAVACATGVFAAVRASAPTFGPARLVTSVDAAAVLQELASADVTGDGNVDVVVTRIVPDRPQLQRLTILAGDGRGGFRDVTTQVFDGPVPEQMWPRRTVLADFNGDGRSDILIADTGYDANPFPGHPNTLILSAPGGKLIDASSNLPRQPDFSHSLAVADIDRNGTVDVYVGNLPTGGTGGTPVPPQVLLNDGTGHFRISTSALPADLVDGRHYDASALIDVNGDRAPDLILGGSTGAPSRVLLNDGNGRFAEFPAALPAKPWGTDANGLAISPIELDSDGHTDLLIAYTKQSPFYKGRWIQVLVNNGNGTFRDETAARLPQADNLDTWPYSIYVEDLNGDRHPDIAVANYWYPPQTPPFYENQGDGTFRPMSIEALRTRPLGMFVLLDANRDSRIDILGTDWNGGKPERHYLIEQFGTPSAVSAARASRGTFRDRVRVSWTPVKQASSYEVWRTAGGSRTRIATTRATTFDDRRVRARTRYRYLVRAINIAGPGPFATAGVGFRR
jgi:VCBS repeat protein